MSAWLEVFWRGMYAHLWQTTLVLALLVVLERLLRDAPARFHSGLWWAGLAKLLLPLPLLAPLVDRARPALPGWIDGVADAGWRPAIRWDAMLEPPGWEPAAVVASPATSGHVWALLTVVWLAGGSAVLALGLRRVRRRATGWVESTPLYAAPEPERSRLLAALPGTGVREHEVLLAEGAVMPSVVGLRRTRLLIPRRAVARLDVDELRAVVVHEQAHRRRRDPFRSLLEVTVLALFFFYPPAWLVARRLARSAEFDCDEAVLRAGLPAATLGRVLARVVDANLVPSPRLALVARSRSLLHQRLDRIREAGRYVPMSRHRVTLAAAVAAVGLFTFVPLPWNDAVGSPSEEAAPGGAAPAPSAPGATASEPQADPQAPGRARQREGVVVARRPQHPELELLAGAQRRVDIDRRGPADSVLRELARRGGFRIEYEGGRVDAEVQIKARNSPVKELLALVARQAGIRYTVPEPDRLVVAALPLLGTLVVRAIDVRNQPLPGVKVTAEGGARSRVGFTLVDGTLRFPEMEPEEYTLTFELAGFKRVLRENLRIAVRRTVAVSVTLERSRTPEAGPSRTRR